MNSTAPFFRITITLTPPPLSERKSRKPSTPPPPTSPKPPHSPPPIRPPAKSSKKSSMKSSPTNRSDSSFAAALLRFSSQPSPAAAVPPAPPHAPRLALSAIPISPDGRWPHWQGRWQERPRALRLSRPHEDHRGPEACRRRPQGHQPLHQGGADVQGQGRPQGHQGSRLEGPQGHGEVVDGTNSRHHCVVDCSPITLSLPAPTTGTLSHARNANR